MDKKADGFGQTLRKALRDRRVIGAGIAGLTAGAAGAFGLPDLIYKKPTKGSRVGLGLSTGALAALATAAAMRGQPDSNQTNLGTDVPDLLHNLPSILQRKTESELKSMSGLTRFVRGYGWGAWNPFRRIYGGLPDWSGLVGRKSDRQKDLQAKGELPKTDQPSAWSWAKVPNLAIAPAMGFWHTARINSRFQQRQMARQLSKVWDKMPSSLKDAIRNTSQGANIEALTRKFNPSRNHFVNFWDNVKDTLYAKTNKLGFSDRLFGLRNYNTNINPNTATSGLIDRLLNLRDSRGGQIVGTHGKKDYRELLGDIKNTKYKRSSAGKILAGTRGTLHSLATLAVLGLLSQPFGGNATMNKDLARNLGY